MEEEGDLMEQMEENRRLDEQRKIIEEAMARSYKLLNDAELKRKQKTENTPEAKRMRYSFHEQDQTRPRAHHQLTSYQVICSNQSV